MEIVRKYIVLDLFATSQNPQYVVISTLVMEEEGIHGRHANVIISTAWKTMSKVREVQPMANFILKCKVMV